MSRRLRGQAARQAAEAAVVLAGEAGVSLRGAVQENYLFSDFLAAPSGCDRGWFKDTPSQVTDLGLPVRCGWLRGTHSVQVAALKFVSCFVLYSGAAALRSEW